MRCIIFFSASQRHSAWDIRSGNRPVVCDEGGFLAKACEMRVQSTRSILRMRTDHAPIFTKKRFYLCCVFPSIKQRVSFCFHALQEQVLRWMKPPTTPLVIGALADLTRGKAELLAENARLAPPTAHPASTSEATSIPKEGPTSAAAPRQDGSSLEGTAMGHGGEFNQPPANPLQAGFFVMGQSRQITSSRGEAPSECFCWRLHRLPHDMALLPQQACKALKRKPMAMGMRAPPAPSIVGGFCQLPSQAYGAGSVAPPVCHLALVAARALLAVIGEDAQSDSKHATTRDGPEAVKPVEKWPRYGEQGLPPHVGRSVEPARYKPCSTVQRSLIPVRRL